MKQRKNGGGALAKPQNTAPRIRDLTDEEIRQVRDEVDLYTFMNPQSFYQSFARAIIKKAREVS